MSSLTCGALLHFLVLLFPPLPRPEETPQRSQLAVTADGRSVHTAYQATGAHDPLLLHHIYNTRKEGEKSE